MATTVKVDDKVKFFLNEAAISGFVTFGEPGTDGPHDGVVTAVDGDGERVDVAVSDSKGSVHNIANLPVSISGPGQSYVSGCDRIEEEKKPDGGGVSPEEAAEKDEAVDDVEKLDSSAGDEENADL